MGGFSKKSCNFAVGKISDYYMKKVTETIKYIGCDDADIRIFESQYVVPNGMCYNSYVIMDKKVAIMDTSDKRTMEQWKKNLEEALEGRQPDYLVVQHLEPDHASGIGEVLALYPTVKVVCSAKAKGMIPLFFPNSDLADRVITVNEGDTLELGEHTLTFVMAPMVHWPEVMVTYDSKDKVLFAADGFGKFGVIDADPDDWASEARRYFINICGKYGAPVTTLLKKAAGLEIEQILPLHGPLLSGAKMAEALRLYTIWSSYGVEEEGIFIAHASIHGNTKAVAEKMADMLRKKGCKNVVITDICREDMHEAVANAFKYGKIVLAASSYDAGLFTPMYNFLHLLQMKAWQKREVAIIENGSWAPSAGRVMRQMLGEMKEIGIKGETLTIRGVMKESDVPALEALADAVMA